MPQHEDSDPAQLFAVADHSANSPVILHAPHAGRAIPAEYLASFVVDESELEAEKHVMTDHHTDTLVASIHGASSVINHLSRFAADVERFPDETEEMNAFGMGVLYTHGSRRQELRRPSEADRRGLMAFFSDYSTRFADLVDATLAQHGRALIIDVHSYPQHPSPYEPHKERARPELCIGFDPFHASEQLVDDVRSSFATLSTPNNEPFQGAYVPLRHYRKDPLVSSVMLEIRRDVYMDEATLAIKAEPFELLQRSVQSLVLACIERAAS